MGLLDKIQDRVEQKIASAKQTVKQAVKSVYNSVVSPDSSIVVSKPQQKQPVTKTQKQQTVPISVVQQKNQTQPIGDVVVTKKENSTNTTAGKNDTSKSKITYKQVAAKNKVILSKAKSVGISEQEILEMLQKRGLTDDIVKNLSFEEQYNILTDIEQSLDYYIELSKKDLIACDVDAVNMIDESAENATVARKNGAISNIKDIKKYQYADKMKMLLGDDFNQLSPEEQESRIETARNIILKEYEADYNKAYNSASKTKKARMRNNKAKLDAFVEKQMQIAYLSVTAVCAEESVRFRDGHDIADAKRVAMDLKVDSASVAAKMTHSWDMKMLNYYNLRGDMPTAQEHQDGVIVSTSRMSLSDITQYEADSNAFKQAYYNGEINAPYLTEDYLTATTVGVGMGATVNTNLTVDEKAAFLKKWDENAQQYSDYDAVREKYYSTVKQYISEHPEAKQGIDDIKTQYKIKYGNSPDIPRAAQKRYDSASGSNYQNNTKNYVVSESDEEQQKATLQQIQQALTVMSYDKARQQFTKNSDKDFAEAIIHNPKLKGHKQHIVGYIKTLSPENLNNITKGCNTDMFLFILRNISPDKAGQLYDLSKCDKCYAARVLGEQIVEEGQRDAA